MAPVADETPIGPAVAIPAAAQGLAAEVATLAGAAQEMLERLGRVDLAGSVGDELSRPAAGVATVVVVGETNRGKSALVNALLSQPGLSPVDRDVATNCYVDIRFSAQPYVHVHRVSQSEPLEVELEDIAAWATVTGNPGNEKGVRSVEVGLPVAFLEGLRLIDTPGVGGLVAAHGALTLEVLREADALLFVTDTEGPLLEPELRFLEQAAERIDTVIIALTKIDAERKWEELRRADAALLRRRASRFAGAPIMPVSSPSRERPDSYGIGELQEMLRTRVIRRAAVLHLSNATRVCQGALRAVEDGVAERLAAVDRDPSFAADMKLKEAKLRDQEEDLADWQDRLNGELDLMRQERRNSSEDAFRELDRTYSERCKTTRRAAQPQLVCDLESELNALTRRLSHQSAERLAATLSEMLGITDEDPILEGAIRPLGEGTDRERSLHQPPPRERRRSGDAIAYGGGFLMGSRIPAIAKLLVPSVGNPAGAVVAAAGIAWVLLMRRSRGHALDQAELASWVGDTLRETKRALENDFHARMIAVQVEIRRAVRAYVRERKRELENAQREYREAAVASQSERERRKKEIVVQLSRVRALIADAAALQAKLA
jgi:hypothetical protein